MAEPTTNPTTPTSPDPQSGSGVIDPPENKNELDLVKGALAQFDDIDLPADDTQDAGDVQDGSEPGLYEVEPRGQPVQQPVVQQPQAQLTQQPVQVQQAPGVQPQAAPQQQPGQQPVQGQQPAPEQQPQQQPVAAPTQDDAFLHISKEVEKFQKEFSTKLAETTYKLTPEETEEIQGNAEVAIPKMMARVQVNTTVAVMRTISQQLPVVIHGMLEAHKLHAQAEDRFWGTWAERGLDKNNAQHAQLVDMVSKSFRSMNPNASEEEAVKFVGAQALVMLGLPVMQQQPNGNGQQPRVRTPGKQVRTVQPGFAPAGVHAAPRGSQPRPVSQWDAMSRVIEVEESGAYDDR